MSATGAVTSLTVTVALAVDVRSPSETVRVTGVEPSE